MRQERIALGKPQQNGRLKWLHLTLLGDIADPPPRSLREQLVRFREFQRLYNEELPHAALSNTTPAEHYRLSPWRWDSIPREIRIPSLCGAARIPRNGAIRWRGTEIYLGVAIIIEAALGFPGVGIPPPPPTLSEALIGEPLASSSARMAVGLCIIARSLGVIDHRGDLLREPRRPVKQEKLTHVVGLICHLCRRLLSFARDDQEEPSFP